MACYGKLAFYKNMHKLSLRENVQSRPGFLLCPWGQVDWKASLQIVSTILFPPQGILCIPHRTVILFWVMLNFIFEPILLHVWQVLYSQKELNHFGPPWKDAIFNKAAWNMPSCLPEHQGSR